MNLLTKVERKINALIKRTFWYREVVFADCEKFWKQKTLNLEIVNLGSSVSKYAFDYSNCNNKAANWAMTPQTFVGDYAILSNYLSFLSDNAIVIITLCPFSCLDDGKQYLPDKMYSIVDAMSIPNFSMERKSLVYDIKENPYKYFPLVSLFSELGIRTKQTNHILTKEEMDKDAIAWIDSWKKQFSLYSLNDRFSLVNQDRFKMAVIALNKLIELCISHNFKPVIVLPPTSNSLLEYFDSAFIKQYIEDYVQASTNNKILFLNYFSDKEFRDISLYKNAGVLNEIGAKGFTNRVLSDLKILK